MRQGRAGRIENSASGCAIEKSGGGELSAELEGRSVRSSCGSLKDGIRHDNLELKSHLPLKLVAHLAQLIALGEVLF